MTSQFPHNMALQQIKIDIVEQPMEFLNGYFFNNE